jgi:hypothetical protein
MKMEFTARLIALGLCILESDTPPRRGWRGNYKLLPGRKVL